MAGKIKTLFSDKEKTEPLFPRTKTSAVSADDGTGLDVLLEHVGYYDDSDGTGASVPVDADSLGGLPADHFASKDYVAVKIAEASMEGSDVDLSGYATKDELNAIDFPVESVNGKTGVVQLTASDVDAAPSGYGLGKHVLAENIDNLFETGVFNVGAATGGTKPFEACDVTVVGAEVADGAFTIVTTTQIAIENNTYKMAVRQHRGGVWGEWIDSSPSSLYGLGDTKWTDDDANNLTETGFFAIKHNATGGHPFHTGVGEILSIGRTDAIATQIGFEHQYGYPDLFIRVKAEGSWQPWLKVNPRRVSGSEYPTIENWRNKCVYTKAIDVGSLPTSGNASVSIGTGITPISIDGYLYSDSYVCPMDGVNCIKEFYYTRSTGKITISVNTSEAADYNAVIVVKYIKDEVAS